MPPYAGFKDLADYIDQRILRASAQRNRKLTRQGLSLELGKSRAYFQQMCVGAFLPSPEMARELAAYFVGGHDEQAVAGEAHIVGVLAGIESPPPNGEARALADKIMGLSKKNRELAAAFVEFLAARK